MSGALNGINIDIGQIPTLTVDSRDALVQLGRDAKAEIGRLNEELDRQGLLVRIQESDTFLKDYANTAADVVGLFSEQFKTSQALSQSLLSQRKEQELIANFAQDQLAALDAQKKIQDALSAAGGSVKTETEIDIGPGTVGGLILDAPSFREAERRIKERFAVGALPDSTSAPTGDGFSEAIAEATKEIRLFDQAVNAGLVDGVDVARERVGLLTDRLRVMLEEGVSPTSQTFVELKSELDTARESIASLELAVQGNAIAFNIFSDVAGQALDSVIFKVNSLKNTLRGVGRQLLSTFVRAGVNVGIGALTGNPLSFGSALGSLVGVGGAATGATGLDAAIAPAQVNAPRWRLCSEARSNGAARIGRRSSSGATGSAR